MLEEVELDAIDVCTPHTLHMEPTLAAAERGLHVFTEKPMATELAECDRMIAACQQAGVVLMVGQVLRFYAPHVEARRIVSSGRKMYLQSPGRPTRHCPADGCSMAWVHMLPT